MRTFTAADIIALHPCYSPEQVRAAFGTAEQLSLREMLALDIPAADKQWLIFRPGILSLPQIDRLFVLFKARDAYAYARADADADAYADARARAYADADARAFAYARAYARARADADAYADARAYADAYADARAYALQTQITDVLTILAEDGVQRCARSRPISPATLPP